MTIKICVVGLGYVGLPLAIEFSKHFDVFGFDINKEAINRLKNKYKTISFSFDPSIIKNANFIVVAVPTPINDAKLPDLKPLCSASKSVGKNLAKGSIVVYESTVYPGCTERDCVPILEKESGLKYGTDFKVGYSPERINPGDPVHTVDKITKVVSGMDKSSSDKIAEVYGKIIKAGIHIAPSIKVAEAAKIIENTQRDINIALMNELKMIFDKMEIDYKDVLEAAGTKWNFIKFTPGLVGGHCIGVDPYYLAYEAKRIGHHPEIILAGRRINDDMPKYEASKIIKEMTSTDKRVKGSKILILGGTFKPNIDDIRNSKVEDLANELKSYGCLISICEPNISIEKIFNFDNLKWPINLKNFDYIIKAVNHKEFDKIKADYYI